MFYPSPELRSAYHAPFFGSASRLKLLPIVIFFVCSSSRVVVVAAMMLITVE